MNVTEPLVPAQPLQPPTVADTPPTQAVRPDLTDWMACPYTDAEIDEIFDAWKR